MRKRTQTGVDIQDRQNRCKDSHVRGEEKYVVVIFDAGVSQIGVSYSTPTSTLEVKHAVGNPTHLWNLVTLNHFTLATRLTQGVAAPAVLLNTSANARLVLDKNILALEGLLLRSRPFGIRERDSSTAFRDVTRAIAPMTVISTVSFIQCYDLVAAIHWYPSSGSMVRNASFLS